MTPHSWQSLCNKKYRLSVRLFLLLNTLSALFSIALPLYNLRAFTLPICLILVSSLAGLLWHWKFPKKKINITLISFLFGCMWAWHIIIKSVELRDNDSTYLLIALLSVLFIGSLAFSNNIIAFMLHSSPTFMGCFWLSSGEITLRIILRVCTPHDRDCYSACDSKA